MIATVLKTLITILIMAVVGLFALYFVFSTADRLMDEGPLPMTAEHVEPWPFNVDVLHVSCCIRGVVSVVLPSNGQSYWFKGGPHVERFPVTMLGKEGLTLDDFEDARLVAEHLARERWPEHIR